MSNYHVNPEATAWTSDSIKNEPCINIPSNQIDDNIWVFDGLSYGVLIPNIEWCV